MIIITHVAVYCYISFNIGMCYFQNLKGMKKENKTIYSEKLFTVTIDRNIKNLRKYCEIWLGFMTKLFLSGAKNF